MLIARRSARSLTEKEGRVAVVAEVVVEVFQTLGLAAKVGLGKKQEARIKKQAETKRVLSFEL